MRTINNYDDYISNAQKVSHPLNDSVKFEEIKGSKNTISIQKYIKKVKTEGKEIITILFVGQTGSGKSTMINGYLNFLLGVLPTNLHRYKIVIGDLEKEKDQTKSQTRDISIYDVESAVDPGKIFRLIDTPGFGDTENKTIDFNNLDKNDVDKSYFDKFEKFFKETLNGKLHAVCFVVKSSENRFNIYQKLIFDTITNLFGKDAVKNFLALFSFSDGEENPGAKTLMMNNYEIFKQKENSNTPWYWGFNCQKYFCELNRAEKGLYELNIENFVNFTSTISRIVPIDIEMTQRNLTLKKELTSIKNSIKDQHLIPLLNEIDLLNKKLAELNVQKEIVKKERITLENLNKSIEAQQNSLKSKKEYVISLEENMKEYNVKIKNINSEIDIYKYNLSDLENSIKNLESTKEKENNEKEELENLKKQTEEKKKNIEDKLQVLKNNNKNSEEIKELERKLNENKKQIAKIDSDVNNLISKKNQIENQINEVKRRKKSIDNNLIQSKNKIDIMKKDQNDLLKQKNNLMNLYDDLKDKDNEKTIIDYENQIKNLEKEKNETQNKEEKYNKQVKIDSNENNLYCDSCEKTCCKDCKCNWGVVGSANTNWFCHKIGFFDHICNVCDHHSDSHKRENKKYITRSYYKTIVIKKTDEEKKQIDTHINILKNMINNIKIRMDKKKSIEMKEKLYQTDIMKQKLMDINLQSKNIDKQYAENIIQSKKDEKQNLMKDIGSLSTQIQNKKKLKEEEEKKNKNELKESQIQNKIITKEIEKKDSYISSLQTDIENREKEKERMEKDIIDKEKQLNLNNEIKENHVKEINEQNAEINNINMIINNLQINRNEISRLVEQKERTENRLQTEFNTQKIKKNDIQKIAFKQLIKIILLINEINNIQMESARKKNIQEELSIILSEFNDNKILDSLKKLIDTEFNPIKIRFENNERQVLEEFGINKKSLLSISH